MTRWKQIVLESRKRVSDFIRRSGAAKLAAIGLLVLAAGVSVALRGRSDVPVAADRVSDAAVERGDGVADADGPGAVGPRDQPAEGDGRVDPEEADAADQPVRYIDAGVDLPPPGERPTMPPPVAVRGLYLNAWSAGSAKRRAQLLRLADRTEVNAFVIDVKEAGEVSYRTNVGLAREIGAARDYIADPRALLQELKERGVYAIARIVVFKDPVLVAGRPDLSIRHQDGGVWEDHHGDRWVDAFNREVWDYNIALALEAAELGFDEIQWDYVRFPDVPGEYFRTAVYPARNGRKRVDAIREFLRYSRSRLAEVGVPVTADVFGYTTSVRNDMGIGQLWEEMADATDALLPMVYPSHYSRGSYGIEDPDASPYRTVYEALRRGVARNARIDSAATIRPWLQDFSLRTRYGAAEVRAQIEAVYDAGLTEWVLWHPGSRYTRAALAPAAGPEPWFAIPDHPDPLARLERRTRPRIQGALRLRAPAAGQDFSHLLVLASSADLDADR